MELIYLPMADLYLSLPLLLAIGLVGGIVSTMLGIGSGIIITPSLMSIGIPSAVAISTQLNSSVGTNFSGFLTYQHERDVDISLAWYLFIGGIAGAIVENLALIKVLNKAGGFAVLKIIVFFVLVICSLVALIQSQLPAKKRVEKGALMRRWMIYFPWHKIFLRSRVEMSILVPIGVGFFTGMVTTSLGGGNSLLIAPILTYLLARTSPVVSGTSLLAGFGINVVVTFISSMGHSLVDFVLLPVLAISSVFGSVIGGRLAYKFKSKNLKIIGALVLMAIAYKMYVELKLANWHSISNGQSYIEKFPNIIKKITAMPDQHWMLPIAQFAHDYPIEYTIITLVSVTIFATVVQFLINRIEWRN
jgi:uncharacterized membrane protein YfcA